MAAHGMNQFMQGSCRFCGSTLPPKIETSNAWQWMFCVLLFLVSLGLLCWIPFTCNSCCEIIKYRCPNCRRIRLKEDRFCKKVTPG